MHVQIYLDIFNRNRSEKIETYKLNEKLGKTYAGNLNDFVETGMHWVNYNGSVNLPRDRAGALMVVSNIDHSYVMQFFGDTADRYFIRHKEGNNWSAWKEYVTKSYIDNKLFQNVIIKQFDNKITSTQNPGELDRIHINIEQQEGYRQVCITRGWITNPKLMIYNLFESGGGADITFANISNTANTGGNVYIQVLFQKV